jgi:hypothetical protein
MRKQVLMLPIGEPGIFYKQSPALSPLSMHSTVNDEINAVANHEPSLLPLP